MTATATAPRPDAPARSDRSEAAAITALSWRVLRDAPASGARNMAIDHALALASREGVGALRLYGWRRPTVSFGRNEPARAVYGSADGLPAGVGAVRRPTGGRAVLHDDELTYAVVVPAAALGGPRATYRTINLAIAEALRSLGARVTVARTGSVSPPGAGPCFREPAAGEVVVGGRKIVGSAQARVGSALLQHGSILLGGDQSVLEAEAGAGTTTLSDLIGPIEVERVTEAVVEALSSTVGGRWRDDVVSREESVCAERLEVERYGAQEWTWRR